MLSWYYSEKKGKKLGTPTHIIPVVHSQKLIQWFRLQINDPVSSQPKLCIEMDKK